MRSTTLKTTNTRQNPNKNIKYKAFTQFAWSLFTVPNTLSIFSFVQVLTATSHHLWTSKLRIDYKYKRIVCKQMVKPDNDCTADCRW